MAYYPEYREALQATNEIAENINSRLPLLNIIQADVQEALKNQNGNCFVRTILAMNELTEREIPHYFMQQAPCLFFPYRYHHAQVLVPVNNSHIYGLVLDTVANRPNGQITFCRELPRDIHSRITDLSRLTAGKTVKMKDYSPGFGAVRMRTALPAIGVDEYRHRTGLTTEVG